MGEDGRAERQETVTKLSLEGGQRFLNALGAFTALETVRDASTVQDGKIEQHERQPAVYKCEGSSGKSVIVALKNTGPLNFMRPVFQRLKERGLTIYLRLTGVAESKIPEIEKDLEGFSRVDSSELDSVQVDVIVRTVDDSPEGASALPQDFEQRNWRATVINVEDFPGNGNKPSNGSPVSHDSIVVIDEDAREAAIARNPNLDPSKIVVTGRPDFDKYAYADVEVERSSARSWLREKHGVPDEHFVVVFSGQLAPAAETALDRFAKQLMAYTSQSETPITFVYSFHPRALTQPEQAGFVAHAGKIFEALRAAGVTVVIINEPVGDPNRPSPDTLGYAADLFVHTHSTEGIASAHRGTPTLSVGFPKEGHEAHYDEAQPGGKKSKAITEGSEFHVSEDATDEEAQSTLKDAIENTDEQGKRIAKGRELFKADGKAGDRVAQVIEDAADEAVPNRDIGKLEKPT
jgi:hypothetical protein